MWRSFARRLTIKDGSTYTKDDRNAAIAAGPALYDKSLYLYWDDDYQLPGQYWRQDKGGKNIL